MNKKRGLNVILVLIIILLVLITLFLLNKFIFTGFVIAEKNNLVLYTLDISRGIEERQNCPSGYVTVGTFIPSISSDNRWPTSIDSKNHEMSNGWLQLCTKNPEKVFLLKVRDDFDKTFSDKCSNYNLKTTGVFKPEHSPSRELPTAFDKFGRSVASGWIALCSDGDLFLNTKVEHFLNIEDSCEAHNSENIASFKPQTSEFNTKKPTAIDNFNRKMNNGWLDFCEKKTEENIIEEKIEICNDGLDNDNDGLIDCDDSECIDNEVCQQPVKEVICGNNILEANEVCDDGNTITETCGDGIVQSGTYCNADCSAELTLSEQCDENANWCRAEETCYSCQCYKNLIENPGFENELNDWIQDPLYVGRVERIEGIYDTNAHSGDYGVWVYNAGGLSQTVSIEPGKYALCAWFKDFYIEMGNDIGQIYLDDKVKNINAYEKAGYWMKGCVEKTFLSPKDIKIRVKSYDKTHSLYVDDISLVKIGEIKPECDDSIDNDGDGFIDMEDSYCESPEDPSEFPDTDNGNNPYEKGCITLWWKEDSTLTTYCDYCEQINDVYILYEWEIYKKSGMPIERVWICDYCEDGVGENCFER